jgi:hypothetical protein
MSTVDFITALFYEVDEQLRAIPKHPEARLWPSAYSTEVCHPVRRKVATPSTSNLPLNPWEGCHPVHVKPATQST